MESLRQSINPGLSYLQQGLRTSGINFLRQGIKDSGVIDMVPGGRLAVQAVHGLSNILP